MHKYCSKKRVNSRRFVFEHELLEVEQYPIARRCAELEEAVRVVGVVPGEGRRGHGGALVVAAQTQRPATRRRLLVGLAAGAAAHERIGSHTRAVVPHERWDGAGLRLTRGQRERATHLHAVLLAQSVVVGLTVEVVVQWPAGEPICR